ncbi:MAG: hypothetical protein M1831_004657 [Alyxoria varia]|nr:MAG: hypothetical protein M1831_004657 [Alyxoria varia]
MGLLKQGKDLLVATWQSQWSAPSKTTTPSYDILVLGLSIFAATTVFLLIQSIFSALEPRRKHRSLTESPISAIRNAAKEDSSSLQEQSHSQDQVSSPQRSSRLIKGEAPSEEDIDTGHTDPGSLRELMVANPPPLPFNSPATPKASTSNGHATIPTIALENENDSPPPGRKQMMPPPPKPVPGRTSSLRTSPNSNRTSLSPPNPNGIPNRSASLANSTSGARSSPQSLSSPTQSPATSTLPGSQNSSGRKKVTLSPGHSPLDWAHLTTTTPNSELSGVSILQKITPTQLALHNGRKGRPAWSSFHGKVYNIGPYLAFHPGGPGELMRGAGKAGEKLFEEIHPWVNLEGMLGSCLVGIMVSEDREEHQLDQQD